MLLALLQSSPVDGTVAEDAAAAAGDGPGWMLPILIVMALFYVVMLGPERKQRKKREEMLSSLKKGQEVMTTGGMYGEIAVVSEDTITLRVSKDVRIKFSRSAIQGLAKEEEPAAETKSEEPKTAEVVEA